jgi:GT2 family glycosyltransferase
VAAVDKLKIAIVILNYNGVENTLECINSVNAVNKNNINLNLIVVDNNSQDDSQKKLKKLNNIKLILNSENLGFTGGMNSGIKYALENGAGRVILLNNDTYVHQDFLINLNTASQKGDIVAPKIYFAPGYEFHKKRYKKSDLGKVIWYAGGKIDWLNVIGTHIGVDEVDSGQFNSQKEIDFATGCCLLVKREVFEKIGFLDDKYFLYLEDMDFSVRAKKNGFKIIFEPKSIIWHKNASSAGGSGSPLQDYYITRNRLIFALKYAKLRTKMAVLKQALSQWANPIKRKALLDFLTFHYGKK